MNKKILIVRGDRQNAKALAFLLSGSGYQVFSHSKAGAAVEAARHQRFDLAITDESLPENKPDLGLVANLKEAQPSLPIFFLTEEQKLETVINCIRAGVTEVIQNPSDLRAVIESTNAFLRRSSAEAHGEEVTWEDMVEVERLLESSLGGEARASGGGEAGMSNAAAGEVQAKLNEALTERDRISGELASTLASLQKAQKLIDELKADGAGGTTDSELLERAIALDERERSLNAMSTRIAMQKVELEAELGEVEAQKIELEEARKEAQETIGSNPAALYAINKQFEDERAKLNAARLGAEARVRDLERELEEAKQGSGGLDIDEEGLRRLREELQDAKDLLSEKDFIIQQRDRELEDARSNQSLPGPVLQEIEEKKRLLEVEKHRLQEKIDRFELERRDFEETQNKRQREIQVERRDAEISLREMQNTIKEEQLKLKVEQASLKEEIRQFEQARRNFQEDVQDLQAKQAELKKMEAYLQEKEQIIKTTASTAAPTLPKPDAAVFEPIRVGAGEGAPEAATPTAAGAAATPAAAAQPADDAAAKDAGSPEDPAAWTKPNFEKKAGRGPLRIGRRSSF